MNVLSCICGGVIESTLFAVGFAVMWLFRKLFRTKVTNG